MLELNI